MFIYCAPHPAPTIPQWVKEAKETLDDSKMRMKAGEELNRKSLQGSSELQDVAELFSDLDKDGSGSAFSLLLHVSTCDDKYDGGVSSTRVDMRCLN